MSEGTSEEVLRVENAWGITRLILNRPDQRNALNPALVQALIDAFRTVARDESVRVVELSAAGDKAFCAGGDFSSGSLAGGGVLEGHYQRAQFTELVRAMQGCGKPVVGIVQGHALGGGFGLAMACDLVVAAEEATFGTPEINVGLFPMMIMPILARNIPRKRLMELMLTGERLSAREAKELGMVNRVVPRAELRGAADALLQVLLQKSPVVMKLGRDAFYRTCDLAQDPALDYLASQLTLTVLTEDAAEGLSAFLQRRPPEWKGR